MHDLALSNGDIVVGQNGHALVSGRRRTLQGITTALKESYGVDRFHPNWGSGLDAMVGSMSNRGAAPFMVESEVRRIVEGWARNQYLMFREQANRPVATRASFTSDEIISAIEGVDVTTSLDRILVRVRLQMLSGATVTTVQTVGDA